MDRAPDVLVQAGVVDDEAQVAVLVCDEEPWSAPLHRVVLLSDYSAVKQFFYDPFCLFPPVQGNLSCSGYAEGHLLSRRQLNSHRNAAGVHGALRQIIGEDVWIVLDQRVTHV